MANEGNLRVPTSEEAREYGRRGGIASGKTRKRKANMKKTLEALLTSKVSNPQLSRVLQDMGFEDDYESALLLVAMQKALKGSSRHMELISKIVNSEGAKDTLDKKEQKARIKALELENRRKAQALDEAGGGADESILIIDDIPND
ncbi:stress-induced protein [Streptococcus parasanguinis]|uniref:stress-induced protein n=1 Tax=Streptococcus parasanguinis TaxID=1318 RepID=UPI00352D258E